MAFKLGNNDLVFEIEDKVYKVPYTKELLIKVADMQKRAIDFFKNKESKLDDQIDFIVGTIDFILGEKVCENEIFKGKEINIFDLIELGNYIMNEVNNFVEKQQSKYSNRLK